MYEVYLINVKKVILNYYQKHQMFQKTSKGRSKGNISANNRRNNIFNLFITYKFFMAYTLSFPHKITIENVESYVLD